jgi:hypothetical protein
MLLKHQQGPIKLYELIEAMQRLNLEESYGLHQLVRTKIKEGNFSRDAYDISISLAYFSRVLKKKNREDLEVYSQILKDIKFMEVHHLRSQHLEYLLEGLKAGLPFLDEPQLQIVRETIPSLIDSIDKDLHRFNFRNLINMLMSFEEINSGPWNLVNREQMA